MPRYELSDGKSNKFWEINLDGDTFTVNYGRIGTSGQSSTKVFATEEKARNEHDKLVKSKEKKGYKLVGESTAPTSKDASNPDLEEAIFADPTSPDAWQAYGEWLSEQGDARGELIALELSGGSERVSAFQQAHQEEWAGEKLTKMIDALNEEGEEGEQCLKIEWQYSFIKNFRVQNTYDVMEPSTADMIRTVMKSPAGKFVQEITVGVTEGAMDGENFYHDILQTLSKFGKLKAVRKVFIGDFDSEECEISWSELGNGSKLLPVMPNLKSLHLRGGEIEIPNFAHAKLEELILETGGLPAAAVKSLCKADLPELKKLQVYFGSEDYGAGGDIGMISPILEGSVFPKLEYLGLMNSEFQNDIAKAIVDAPILSRIKVLDMSLGTLTDEGAKALLENAEKLKHLEKIDLDDNFISDELSEKLEQALPGIVEVGGQEEPDEYNGEVYLYVSVSE